MALETREFVVKPQGLKQFGRFESLACIILREKSFEKRFKRIS